MSERALREFRIAALAAATVFFALTPWKAFAENWPEYLWPLLAAALLLTFVSALLRSLKVPRILVLLLELPVAAEALLVLTVGRWLPDASAWSEFASRMGRAATVAHDYAAPVPSNVVGLAPLIITLGLGVILVFDLLAATARRAGLAGLLLIAVQTTTAALLDEPLSWATFLATAICFGALLASVREIDLIGWTSLRRGEHTTGGQATERFNTRVASLRIGLTAAAVAVVAPFVVPMFGSGTFSALKTNGSDSGGNGKGSYGLVSPFLDMKKNLTEPQNVPLAYVTSPQRPEYFQISVLDQFDGKFWYQGPRQYTTPSPDLQLPELSRSQGTGSPQTYTVRTLSAYTSKQVPAPYPPGPADARLSTVKIDPDTWEIVPNGLGLVPAGFTVTMSGYPERPTQEQLGAAPPPTGAIASDYTQLPDNLPNWVYDISSAVTATATSNYEKAVALQAWFRNTGGFTYSLEGDTGSGLEQLHKFVTTNKSGYCEQFATAMALFGRALGIPSRVVIGFRSGAPTAGSAPAGSSNAVWTLGAHDLHAWPEMYFPGVGWVRFEPTPNVGAPSWSVGSSSVTPPSVSAPTVPVTRNTKPAAPTPSESTGTTITTTTTIGSLHDWLWLLVVVVVGLLGGLPRYAAWVVRRWRRRRATSDRSRAEVAWREVLDQAENLGYDSETGQTLRTTAADLSDQLVHTAPVTGPVTAAALSRVAHEVEAARYSSHYRVTDTLERDLGASLSGLDASVGSRRRRRAIWWPAAVFKRR